MGRVWKKLMDMSVVYQNLAKMMFNRDFRIDYELTKRERLGFDSQDIEELIQGVCMEDDGVSLRYFNEFYMN